MEKRRTGHFPHTAKKGQPENKGKNFYSPTPKIQDPKKYSE